MAESLRNINLQLCEPLGIVDHLQFGNPENEEIFWTFVQTIEAIKDYCKYMNIPVVGGKVSLYNETIRTNKTVPCYRNVRIISSKRKLKCKIYNPEESIFIIGNTNDEMGGSEYFEYCLNLAGGDVPKLDLPELRQTIITIKSYWVKRV